MPFARAGSPCIYFVRSFNVLRAGQAGIPIHVIILAAELAAIQDIPSKSEDRAPANWSVNLLFEHSADLFILVDIRGSILHAAPSIAEILVCCSSKLSFLHPISDALHAIRCDYGFFSLSAGLRRFECRKEVKLPKSIKVCLAAVLILTITAYQGYYIVAERCGFMYCKSVCSVSSYKCLFVCTGS